MNTPDILFKYINGKRMRKFLDKPNISFSSVCLFEDKEKECVVLLFQEQRP